MEYNKFKFNDNYHDMQHNIILELTIVQQKKFSPNEQPTGAVLSDTHIGQCVIRQSQLDSHVASKHHIA